MDVAPRMAEDIIGTSRVYTKVMHFYFQPSADDEDVCIMYEYTWSEFDEMDDFGMNIMNNGIYASALHSCLQPSADVSEKPWTSSNSL